MNASRSAVLDVSRRIESGHIAPLNVNVGQILCDLNSSFNPLHRDFLLDYNVQVVAPGQVCMSVVMPSELLHSFQTLLESMSGFFRFVGNKTTAAAAVVKAHDLDEIAKSKKFVDAFNSDVCTLFDKFIKQGFSMIDARKQTNLAMKAENHPWANSYTIERHLRSAGRLRKSQAIKKTRLLAAAL